MPNFKWTDWPFIILLTILVFGMMLFIVMGIDLFPGYSGGRWVALVVITGLAGILSDTGRDDSGGY